MREIKKSPSGTWAGQQINILFFFQSFFYQFYWHNLFFKSISAGFFRPHGSNYLRKILWSFSLQGCNNFLGHDYLISLWIVDFLKIGLYFFNSNLSVVFFLFFVVMYLDVPGLPLFLCSVHSSITCTLLPFFAIAMDIN